MVESNTENAGKQGYCYKCGDNNLYFKNSLGEVIQKDNFNNQLVFTYICGSCHAIGQDVFSLVFLRNVKFPDY